MIWALAHTPRSGSNWLMDCLASHPEAGVNPESVGFNIGYGDQLKTGWPAALEAYFQRPGHHGFKIDWPYLDHLAQYAGPDCVNTLLAKVDKWVYLSRRDTDRQAVSWYVARATGQYISADAAPGPFPDYNYWAIDALAHTIQAQEARWWAFFNREEVSFPYPVIYERLTQAPLETTRCVFDHLGLASAAVRWTHQPLSDPRKANYVQRYRAEQGSRLRGGVLDA